jgi:hypothetical protein
VNINKLIAESLAIETQEAKEAGALGYMARVLVQATMPHKKSNGDVFERKNGAFSMAMIAHPGVGVPYGTYPRLLLSWLTTEAVRTKTPELILGPTLSGFMNQLGLIPAGGRWGTIHRLRDQMRRLFSSTISCAMTADTEDIGMRMGVALKYRLWWDPKSPDQSALWLSSVTLSHDFFKEIVDRPVPIDMRALQALKRSPMALDIYCWLTYRLSYLRKKSEIPWPALQAQFGAGYPETVRGTLDFKRNFLKHLRSVQIVYPQAKVAEGSYGLLLKPSKPHIPLLPRT